MSRGDGALRVLILEDEPLIAMLMEDWLADLGCEVVGPASTVAAGLKLAQTETIDCAILDVTIGTGTSYEVADALIAKGVDVAFATGHGAAGVDPRFARATVIDKPFVFENVSALIDGWR